MGKVHKFPTVFDRLKPMNIEDHEHMAEVVAAVNVVLEHFGIDSTADNNWQLLTCLEAVKVYSDRTRAYGQVWQQYGALANLLNAARKADRLMAVWWTEEEEYVGNGQPVLHKDAMDDAIDLINYTVFFMRAARAGNLMGQVPQRPADG
jgi:hypothetical protein